MKVKRTENSGMALDFDQVALLHEVGSALYDAGVARFWGAIFTAVSVGLRKAEVMGLRWQDVNLEQGILQIRHTAISHRGQPIREEVTKTSHSRRDVQIPPSLKALLNNHREAQALEKFNAGDAWTETGAVFATLTGAWTHPDNLNRALTSLLGWLEPQGLETRLRGVPVEHRAKLKAIVQDGQPFPRISPHDLRHTAGTLMLRKNVPVEVVSKTLGHADISITYKVYRHVLESEKREHVVDLFDHIPPKRVFESAIVN